MLENIEMGTVSLYHVRSSVDWSLEVHTYQYLFQLLHTHSFACNGTCIHESNLSVIFLLCTTLTMILRLPEIL